MLSTHPVSVCFLPLLLCISVMGQESLTLPIPCPVNGYDIGSASPSFEVALVNGSTFSFTYPGDAIQLPLVAFALDAQLDPGGYILATDAIEVDRFLLAPPPASGTFLILGYEAGLAATLAAAFEARIVALRLPPSTASAWRARLAFVSPSLAALTAQDSAISQILSGWQSPRLWLSAARLEATPRVDGFYECYQWPLAAENFTLVGPVEACAAVGAGDVPSGAMVLVVNTSSKCPPQAASDWAQKVAPNAAGAVIGADTPQLVGRNCADAFYDAAFFPMIIGSEAASRIAAETVKAGGSVNMSISANCSTGTWFAIDHRGNLQTVGWRKYTEAYTLRWALDYMQYIAGLDVQLANASQVIPLIPVGTVVNTASFNISFPSVAALRENLTRASLEFTLSCPGGQGDNSCGPWDRIISASALCWQDSTGYPGTEVSTEIGRWITPFRRGVGRWITSAAALLPLIGNGSSVPSASAWTCTISSTSCCEPWAGELNLLLYRSPIPASASAAVPFALTTIFPLSDTHFGPSYNANRSVHFQVPVGAKQAFLWALISGHGSAPPPPVSQGCEYSPTSHAFAIAVSTNQLTASKVIVNTSSVAFSQYMEAGSIFGCSSKVSEGVIANSHGDWRDGRDGWCPGQVVFPLNADISGILEGEGGGGGANGTTFELSYSALSYYVGTPPTHPSSEGCGGDIVLSASILFFI
jgi:hypothetical protein